MGLDSPCPPCPVMNKIYGPRTYLDPIRKIYETVDAVELKLSDEKVGHAMVFSTVAEGERLASEMCIRDRCKSGKHSRAGFIY